LRESIGTRRIGEKHKIYTFPLYGRNFRTLSFVDNENILQSCATVFAGVLILLTLERKFEAKDIAPEYIHKLNRQREDISSYVKKQENERKVKEKEIIDLKKGTPSPREVEMKESQLARIKGNLEKAGDELKLTIVTIQQVRDQQAISFAEQLRAQRLKDIEDFVTLTTLALFSSCIVFMIFADTNWSCSIFNYSSVSKFLFSIALLVLLVRVYLRSKELKTYRIPFLGKK
jgi:hypothetical protein